MSVNIEAAAEIFTKQFGAAPDIAVRAPGRVNIIGEHTDYNHGFVLPMAIERDTVLLARRRSDPTLDVFAANLDRRASARLDARARNPLEPWLDYLVGVADELAKLGMPLHGADVAIVGDVPLGCGLSSSAALEMAALCMFEALGGFEMDGPEAARLGQRVENVFLGLSTGIMDQFISRCARADHALFLDCRSFAYELIPIAFPNALFVIANTCCARKLTASKYNERVGECNEAILIMRDVLGGPGNYLRDYDLGDLESIRPYLSEEIFRRARHVISENDRTRSACDAMRAGDAARLGTLMTASDASLRGDYMVTSPELDAMTAVARGLEGCFGARNDRRGLRRLHHQPRRGGPGSRVFQGLARGLQGADGSRRRNRRIEAWRRRAHPLRAIAGFVFGSDTRVLELRQLRPVSVEHLLRHFLDLCQ